MKIFAIYTNLVLIQKPEWLAGFVEKYNPWGLHVTLKQACFIEEEKIEHVKKEVTNFFSAAQLHPIPIAFNNAEFGTHASDPIIVLAEQNEKIVRLQQEVCSMLSGYNRYVDPVTQKYEREFRPHMTISYDIPDEEYPACLEKVKHGCRCEGIVTEVILSAVNSITLEEARNPANKTVYKLLPWRN